MHAPNETHREVRPEDVRSALAKRLQLPPHDLESIPKDLATHLSQKVFGQDESLRLLEQAVIEALTESPAPTNHEQFGCSLDLPMWVKL